jgi:hypothetical protein
VIALQRFAAAAVVFATLSVPAGASAAPATPAWSIQSLAAPTNFKPGDESGFPRYEVFLTNKGGAVTDQSPITITDTLPAGLVVKKLELKPSRRSIDISNPACETTVVGEVSTVSCEVTNALFPAVSPAKLYPSEQLLLQIYVGVPATVSGTLTNLVEVEGGGAAPVSTEASNQASDEDAIAGFQEFKAELTGGDGLPATAADSHPYQYTTAFAVNLQPSPPGAAYEFVPADGELKDIEVALPPGLAANPTAIGRCSAQQFNENHAVFSIERDADANPNECPADSAVGVAFLEQLNGQANIRRSPIYNLIPPKGMPAQLGFQVLGAPIYINTRVRSDGDYGSTAYLTNVPQAERVTASWITIWGTPWEESHDRMRGECALTALACPVEEGTPRPFLRAPSWCGNPLLTTMSYATWAHPVTGAATSSQEPAPVGCSAPDFSPTVEAQPTTNVADSPTGLHFNLHMPQIEHEVPEELGEADLRDVTVRLPAGLNVNPASADGLEACTIGQVGLSTEPGQSPIHFNMEPAQCPDGSKIGTVSANVPAVDHPIEGSVYLAKQGDNPFRSLIAIYIVLEDPQTGIIVKLAARVSPDPLTGQLTTTVTESPQVPVEDFQFDFFEGARAPLRTPMRCGGFTTATTMVPWTAPEGASASPASSFQITGGPAGACPSGALEPRLSAGLANATAGAYSPFHLRLTRADATAEFAGLTTITPLGLVAKLAGVPYCSEAGIAHAAALSQPGQGAAEAASPSCPQASRVGTVTAGAGAGSAPFYTGGPVYLAGPYKGAPLSLVAIIPALAGPFDLGVVVNRIALRVNPETAQVTAEADPLPTILSGILLDVRDLRVSLDRPNFTLAPTNCEVKSVTANVLGTIGTSSTVSDRFQVGGCQSLGFKPQLSLKLSGGTKRSSNPALRAVVTYPKGAYANIARASVALPHSEFLDQGHIRTICTRVQFAADACPKGSIYGKARVITPLLDAPLEGPVYLRSSSNLLPDLVVSLAGQINVDLVGRIDSINGGIRTTFEAAPDAPISKFILMMQGGKKGLLVNSRNICNHTNRAAVKMTGQNGKEHNFRAVIRADCRKGSPAGKQP